MELDEEVQVYESNIRRKWEDLDENLLLKILATLNILDLTFSVSGVCQYWRKVSQEPCLWGTVDMDLISDSSVVQNNHNCFSSDFNQKLETILTCSKGNTISLICSTFWTTDVSNWVYLAERTPMLKRLVLSVSESIAPSGFCEAVKRWPALQTLTAAWVNHSKRLLIAISENCPKFSEQKHMGLFDHEFAMSIIAFLPNLKVLSLRGSLIQRGALVMIFEKLENLEVLNISHCLMVRSPGIGGGGAFSTEDRMLERASRLKSFITCRVWSCHECLRAARHYRGFSAGGINVEDIDDSFWKKDELSCFSG